MSNGYWDHIEEAFSGVNIYEGPDILSAGLKNYSPWIVDLLAAHWFVSEVLNGGILQFYLNPTGILAPEVVKAFENMELHVVAGAVNNTQTFLGHPFPRKHEERVGTLLKLTKCETIDDLFGSDTFSDSETQIYNFGGDFLERIYARMDSYAEEKSG